MSRINLNDCIKQMREEAEATKPCVCGEPLTPGVVHRTDGPCYVQEATKPQERIAELKAERDALKAENIALISSGLKNEAERGNDGFLMTKIADLVQERDALAITVHQLREAIKRQLEADDRLMNAPFNVSKEEYEAALEEHSASHDAFVKLINEKLINEPDTTVNIIKRHDAAVLAEVVDRIIDAASAGSETGVEVVRTMIKEIGAQL